MDKQDEHGVVVTSQMSVADDSGGEKPEKGAAVGGRQLLAEEDEVAKALPDTQRSERDDAGIELQPI